jgi:hypothetical protein
MENCPSFSRHVPFFFVLGAIFFDRLVKMTERFGSVWAVKIKKKAGGKICMLLAHE